MRCSYSIVDTDGNVIFGPSKEFDSDREASGSAAKIAQELKLPINGGWEVLYNYADNTLQRLRKANPARCRDGFGHAVTDMPILFWSTAVAGEVGEMCNIIKKVERGDKIDNWREMVAKEAADVVIYLDLLCTSLEIDLETSIINKFNEVSDRVGSKIKL